MDQITYRTLWKRSNLGQQDKDHRIITPTSNKVQVDFYCEAAKELCKNIENGLISMAVFLENAINLTHPISIQASFYPFCEGKDECPEGDNYMLGQALPSRSFPIADEKGIIRLYPQALYKQLIPKKPRNVEYHQYDIFAEFNSKAPYYFPNSRIKGGDKASFLDLISHELLHGLGFVTSIDDHFNKGLATFLPDIQSEDKDSKQVQ
ncbi:hypothetical protein K502DRAFT_333894 [Neoconidiobolus thromboides FSU 785]|nr:hypothetical protein K502DRAFT_333894 [Neoconidiobolus thromboides FSU 785]